MEFVYMKRLDKKVALITGAARGIGFVIAKAYKGEGAIVVIADINLEAAQKAAVEISDNTFAIQMDVTSQESIDNAINEVVAKVGKIDILINNAALFDAAKTVDISRDSYEKLYAVNVAGTLFTLQAVAKQMIKQAHWLQPLLFSVQSFYFQVLQIKNLHASNVHHQPRPVQLHLH